MTTDVPRRLRRFYRDGKEVENDHENENAYQEVPQEPTEPVRNGSSQRSTNIEELKSRTKGEAIALTMHEIRRFMRDNNRTPQTDEQDEIAENLYHQLKSDINDNQKETSVADRARARNKKMEKDTEKEATAPVVAATNEKKLNQMDFSDLLSDNTNNSSKKATTLDDLELDLSSLDLSGTDIGIDHANQNENVVVEQENAPGNCPHCNRPTDSPVYCPNCGNAFCPNCAKQAASQVDKILYTCPVCNHAFSTRKR